MVHVRIEQLNKRQHQGTLTCKIVNEVGYDERPIRVTFIRTPYSYFNCSNRFLRGISSYTFCLFFCFLFS